MNHLYAPISIAKKISVTDQITSAPDIGVPGGALNGSASDSLGFGVIGSVPGTPPAPVSTEANRASSSGPIHVRSVLEEANLVRRVVPVYPPLAKSARVQGTVEFTALISKDGNIKNLQLVHGHPLLVEAARQAVEQWRYRPSFLNGVPVDVITDIIVNFTLNQ